MHVKFTFLTTLLAILPALTLAQNDDNAVSGPETTPEPTEIIASPESISDTSGISGDPRISIPINTTSSSPADSELPYFNETPETPIDNNGDMPFPVIPDIPEFPDTASPTIAIPETGFIPPPPEPENQFGITQTGPTPFHCPIEKIRNAYEILVNPESMIVALAIEKQILAICRESQKTLIEIAENEARLVELFNPILYPAPPPEPEIQPEPTIKEEPEPIAPNQKPESVVSTLGNLLDSIEITPVETFNKPEFTPPEFTLGAITKGPGGWKAMIIDNNGVIFSVRPGEMMPDGTEITGIEQNRVEMLSRDKFKFYMNEQGNVELPRR